MAKKATIKRQGGKEVTKCVKMVKNPQTAGYYFREEMVPNDKVDSFFKEEKSKKKEEEKEG